MNPRDSSHVARAIASQVRRWSRIAAALPCALLAACAVDAPEPAFGTYETKLVAQLDAASQALADKGLALHLVGYTAAAPLDTDDAVTATKAQLLHAGALVPQFDGMNASSLRLDSIAARMQAYRAGTNEQNVITNIETMAFPSLKAGQKTLDVTWENEGREFQTRLVYDDNGVVYDNMLSNIAFVNAEAATVDAPPAQPAGTATEPHPQGITALANQIFSTRFINLTITWIWGGTRGQVQLDHYVISCDNWRSFCDDGGQSNAWMTLGSAAGKTRRHALIKPRISKLAWGYGWATPTASFSITWNAANLTFSASTSGIGSAGKGSGIHPLF